jgi:glycosyltransferase involved in cell wall biosynthesis
MISVVIPAHNEEAAISRCLESLVQQDYKKPYELILVDNASTDNTVPEAKKFIGRLPLKIIHETQKGRGIARHTGFIKARGDIILSTDSDCIIPPDWIRRMDQAFSGSDCQAVTGSCTVNTWPYLPRLTAVIVYELYYYGYRLSFRHFPLVGFNFGVRKDAYLKTGGFDTSLNAAEDVDLGFKINRFGKIIYRHIPVDYNPRRYNDDFIGCIISYMRINILYFLSLRKKINLSDVR